MFLSPEIILKAYSKGIFPMSDSFDDPFIYWVDPQIRGIIHLDEFKISKSLKKTIKKKKYLIKINKNFEKVINLCAKNAKRKKTWINKQIISNYTKLFKIGKAKSVECYFKKKLVGGLYGITVGNIFCGESMFSIEKDASKISMVYLAAHLIEGGFEFIDTQFYSSHLKQFGTKKIIRNDYKKILSNNKKKLKIFPENISDDILNYFS
ncbi:MAG: leucyl/phenylalanyl-tRNA--protein transferase [Alphaproteobacteria bacterium]|nr:leucyl/phenylalanyl-tRNA--protein transferase [Alphaproteobacteria bacterium]